MRRKTAHHKYSWFPEPPLDIDAPYRLGNYAFEDVSTKIAWENLRTYKKNGFKNLFFEFEETNRGFHPSCCKLVADTF